MPSFASTNAYFNSFFNRLSKIPYAKFQPEFDPEGLQRRRGSVAVLLIGGSHDFSDNLKEFDPKAELIILKVKAYSEIED